jgi:hypothetical protein
MKIKVFLCGNFILMCCPFSVFVEVSVSRFGMNFTASIY